MQPQLIHGDCRRVLPQLAAASCAAAITDPPYEIGLMGQSWDRDSAAFEPATWREIARIVSPGGFVAAFGGRQSWHHLALAVEQGGLTIVDNLAWWYTTGNVTNRNTRLRTAWEPIILAQVPAKQTLRATMRDHGTGHLGIAECRLPYLDDADLQTTLAKNPGRAETFTSTVYGTNRPQQRVNPDGRHPANLIVDERIAEALDRDQRYFVCPKASPKERDAGLTLERGIAHNPHSCVKPLALMEWLVRLLCPPGGTVLDAFAGSASTGCAALPAGRQFIGIENDPVYVQTGRLRLAHWARQRADEPQVTPAASPAPPSAQLTF